MRRLLIDMIMLVLLACGLGFALLNVGAFAPAPAPVRKKEVLRGPVNYTLDFHGTEWNVTLSSGNSYKAIRENSRQWDGKWGWFGDGVVSVEEWPTDTPATVIKWKAREVSPGLLRAE